MTSPRLYTVEAIVLRRRNTGEADRVITFYTKELGKIRAIAKGIRRVPSRRSGYLEVFSHIRLTLHRARSLDIVTEAQSKETNGEFGNNLQKVSYAYYLCELVDALTAEHQEHDEIFALLNKSLRVIHSSVDELAWQHEVFAFALQLLWILGFLPRSRHLPHGSIQQYVEHIIERKLRTPQILTKIR